ncbi:DUF4834 family protein [Alistipes sp. ZOR0009]|jgi:hypothetical protein|uniref:DUF4834 family protein n=1 Tax=Alistipes sp. ZOR0009 TaxID=1339253 RepID=UPI0006478FA0|nr:DUF4834 family protein [Alistipes sp. ZOR0009]
MEGFLTFILFMILGIYVLGFVGKLILKMYLRKVQKQFEGFANNAGAQYQQYSRTNTQDQSHEGDVTISQSGGQDKKFKKDVGDYVDFEEVK